MGKPTINQVLLFQNPDKSRELGEVLWAAAKEVENFYNQGEPRAVFRYSYLSEIIPDNLQSFTFTSPWLQKTLEYFTGKPDQKLELNVKITQSDSRWKNTEGEFTRTYDEQKIARMVREILGERKSEDIYANEIPIVVTDLLLTPPKDWRYVIWYTGSDWAVISTAPTDPKYWRIKDPDRIAVIKHRVRSALLSVVGEFIGLKRCDNEQCFLFENIDSVTRLDRMFFLGPEHDIEALKESGFESLPKNPSEVQPIIKNF